MPEFFQTLMGRKYYEHDLPEQTKAMNRLAKAIEKQNELKEEINKNWEKVPDQHPGIGH